MTMMLLGCTPPVLLIVHPSGTETVIQSCQEEKISDWVEVTDLYDDKKEKEKEKKKEEKHPSLRRVRRESSSPHYLLTVSQ